MKQLKLSILAILFGASTYAQRDIIDYKGTLERFKDYGAMVISPDTAMISILKREVTFGEIFGKKEADPNTFKGVFIIEYSNTPVGYTYSTTSSMYAGYFLAVNDKYLKPTEHPGSLKKSLFITALRVPNELREKLPMYAAVFNGLLEATYEENKDISVLPEDRLNVVNKSLGSRVKQIKDKELLIANFEAGETILNASAIKNLYPYKYKIVELPELVNAFDNHEEGKMVMVTAMLENYVGKYIVDCETHQLLYGRQHISRSRYVHDRDLGIVKDAVEKAQ